MKTTFSTLAVMSAFVLSAQALEISTNQWANADFQTGYAAGDAVNGTGSWSEATSTAKIAETTQAEYGKYVDLNYTEELTYNTGLTKLETSTEIDTRVSMDVYMVGSTAAPVPDENDQTQVYLHINEDQTTTLKAYDAVDGWKSLDAKVENLSWMKLSVSFDYAADTATFFVNDVLAGTVSIGEKEVLSSVSFAGAGSFDNFVGTRSSGTMPTIAAGGTSSDEVKPGDATENLGESVTSSLGVDANGNYALNVTFPGTKPQTEEKIQFVFFKAEVKDEEGKPVTELRCARVTSENPTVSIPAEVVGDGKITAYYGNASAVNVYGESEIKAETKAEQVSFGTDSNDVSFQVPVKSGLYYTVVAVDDSGKETSSILVPSQFAEVEDHGVRKLFSVKPAESGVVRFKIIVSDSPRSTAE